MLRHLCVAILFGLLSVAMTWPLATVMNRAVAYPGDPYINAWILDWGWWATFHQPLSLFHANVFYPARWSLAFSENLYGIALVLMPFRFAGLSALEAYNVAVLLGFAFSGFAAYLLGWTVTRSSFASIAGGIFFAFVPFRFTHVTHVQHIWSGWLVMTLVALIAMARKPTWRRAAFFAAMFVMNGLTNIHWLLFGTIALLLTAMLVVRGKEAWIRLAVAGVFAALILAPFLYPYHAASGTYGMRRSLADTASFSATPKDWLTAGTKNRLYAGFGDTSVDAERWLFPGLLAIAAGIAGAVAGRRESPIRIAGLWILLGFLGSLGTNAFFHPVLFEYVPGFQAIRAPARWANVAYVGMALLVAAGVASVTRRREWIAAIVSVLFLAELRAAPLRWYLTTPEVPAADRWLAGSDRRVAEIPLTGDTNYSAMLHATAHHRPIVNGLSGFAPAAQIRFQQLYESSEIGPDLVSELHAAGVDTILVHADAVGQRFDVVRRWLAAEIDAGRLFYVKRFNNGLRGDWIFSTKQGRRAAPELTRFLAGESTPSDGTFGVLDYPFGGETVRGPIFVSGWTLSPHGIASVECLFANGRVRHPASLIPEPSLLEGFPFYPAMQNPRFACGLNGRPPGVPVDTDVQIVITDGRGEQTWLEGRFFRWE